MWRGVALADVAYEGFARTESERLEELHLVAVEERIDAELALGRHDTVIAELETLTARHPLRERLRGQLMLALYRAGRQAEALRVYAETRRRLVDELGIEPGKALRDLEQAILRQDPALHLRPALARRRRTLAGALALGLAGAAAGAVVLATQGGTESAQSRAQPESNIFLAADSGKVLRQAPLRGTEFVRFGFGSLWSISQDGELTRLDPETGETIAVLGLGVRPGGFAVGAGSVWVTDEASPTLFRIDPRHNVVADRFDLPTKRVVSPFTHGVTVGAGSVWIGHGSFNPGAWVERLDPTSGTVQRRFSILGGGADHVAFGDGALWVGSPGPGELRKIDPRTNKIVRKVKLHGDLCCVAVGGGYVWAAINPDAAIWKLDRDGSTLATIKLPAAIQTLTYADGALWAAVGEAGIAVRIDPTTNARRTYRLGHDVSAVDVHHGLIGVGVRQSSRNITSGLEGRVVRIAVKGRSMFWSGSPPDPALYTSWDVPQVQFHYATCAKLYNHPDVEGEAGRNVVPEVAAALPRVSDDGRMYTIRIREGFRFSPPSNEAVTAESFRRAFEREMSPKFDWFHPRLSTIVGAEAYHAGKTRRIAGISARGDTLVIRLTKPAPDLVRGLALYPFCAVPAGTPVVSQGLETPVPSAGPYYLAELAESAAVLKRNPNYGGTRPQRLDAIVYLLGIPPGEAAARIAKGTLDYVLEYDPALARGGAAARAAGSRYRRTNDGTASVGYLALNWRRPLFADRRMRLAVQHALDRTALAELEDGLPATRLLSPRIPGYDPTPLYGLRPDLPTARRLAGNARRRGVLLTFDPKSDPHSAAFVRAVREPLAAIGLSLTILPLTNRDFDNDRAGVIAKGARADLWWGGLNAETGDPVDYLRRLFAPAEDSAEVNRIAKLPSPRREQAAVALAKRLEHKALYAVYMQRTIPELVSSRLGCIVHQPQYAGVDLAALCLKAKKRD